MMPELNVMIMLAEQMLVFSFKKVKANKPNQTGRVVK